MRGKVFCLLEFSRRGGDRTHDRLLVTQEVGGGSSPVAHSSCILKREGLFMNRVVLVPVSLRREPYNQ